MTMPLKPVPTPPQAPASTRMTLKSVVKGKLEAPYRILLYGPEGVGKSTFGADAPSPIFIGAEDGTRHLDVARFPAPETVQDVFEAVRVLTADAHEYQTLVLDTLDWVEPLIWREVCRRDNVSNIEEVGGGYMKGYTVAVDEWRKLVAALERLQATKRMHVVLLAHSHIKTFKNPEGEDYDRYEIKLHPKASGLVKEWCEAVLFAREETLVHKAKGKRPKGVGVGARIIYTERSGAYDAKNRYTMPAEIPLSWADFDAAVKAGRVAPAEDLRSEILRKAKELGGELEKAVLENLERAGTNPQHLALLNNRVNARLAEKAAASTTAAQTAEKAS
jgi:DNA polymerase III delta prime subunit